MDIRINSEELIQCLLDAGIKSRDIALKWEDCAQVDVTVVGASTMVTSIDFHELTENFNGKQELGPSCGMLCQYTISLSYGSIIKIVSNNISIWEA